MNSRLTFVDGQNGEKLLTEIDYASFVHYYEQFAYDYASLSPDLELVNTSIGGAQINGFKNLSLESVLGNLKPLNESIESIIRDTLKNYNNDIINNLDKICDNFVSVNNDVWRFLGLAKKGEDMGHKLAALLGKSQLDVAEIERLSRLLIEIYVDFKDNLIAKNQHISTFAFKELLLLTKFIEDDKSAAGIDYLKDLARTSIEFYAKYKHSASSFIFESNSSLSELSKLKENKHS